MELTFKLKVAKIGDQSIDYDIDDADSQIAKPPALTMLDLVKNMLEGTAPLPNDVLEKNVDMMYIAMQSLSYYPDITLIVDYFNKSIPPIAQYKAMFYAIPKTRRFEKWPKNNADDTEIIAVSNYYDVSYRVAAMYMKLLSSDDIAQILEIENVGGMGGKSKTSKKKDIKKLVKDTPVEKPSKPKPEKLVKPEKKKVVNKDCPISNNPMRAFFK